MSCISVSNVLYVLFIMYGLGKCTFKLHTTDQSSSSMMCSTCRAQGLDVLARLQFRGIILCGEVCIK